MSEPEKKPKNKELEQIKKIYGEKFMHLCRSSFPTLLETEGRLSKILESYFANNSRSLYDDITKNGLESLFKDFIYGKADLKKSVPTITEQKTPYELLDEAGYTLKECKSEREIQKFKKYYKAGEELCTFDGGRLEYCHVFFAVRKDVKNIKRENFDNPKREDEYGTSVMSIQFNKEGKCTVSIKNRYNHKVDNPDATYGNDLDRITPGLTQSFGRLLKQRGLELDSSNVEDFEIPNYVVASDGKYYKYNMWENGAYYCPGNIIIDRRVHQLPNEWKQLLVETYLIDLEDKKILSCVKNSGRDSFLENLQDLEKIKIEKIKQKGTKVITLQKKGQDEPIKIEIDNDNQIIGYEDHQLTSVGDNFLPYNRNLRRLILPNVKEIGDDFLPLNECLRKLELPMTEEIGDNCLSSNENLEELSAPELTNVGVSLLESNRNLGKLYAPSLQNIQDPECFLSEVTELTQLEMPYVEGVTKRLFKMVRHNRVKQMFKGQGQKESEIEQDEGGIGQNSNQAATNPIGAEKFERIYRQSREKGIIGRTYDRIKSFIAREGQKNENSQEHGEEIE